MFLFRIVNMTVVSLVCPFGCFQSTINRCTINTQNVVVRRLVTEITGVEKKLQGHQESLAHSPSQGDFTHFGDFRGLDYDEDTSTRP